MGDIFHWMSIKEQLNSDQTSASKKLKEFLTDPATVGEVFTLTGGPGTGKTFMLRAVLEDTIESVQGATISHAAKNVLKSSLGKSAQCVTVAALLGMEMSINDLGEIHFTSSKNARSVGTVGNAKILIIDEASQINDELYNIIRSQCKTKHVRIIAVGDPYQLPPVGQEHDSAFFNNIDFELTIPMRFQGPIADIAYIYKHEINRINNGLVPDKWALNVGTSRQDNVIDGTGYTFTNNAAKMLESAAKDIAANPTDMSCARVLAFRNDVVKQANERIRGYLYGDNLKQFEQNEVLICDGGYTVRGNHGVEPVLYNGQLIQIESYKPAIGPYEIPCLLVKPRNFETILPIYVVDSIYGKDKYNDKKNALYYRAKNSTVGSQIAKANWAAYYNFIASFADFDYAYSLNLYKAQGQTINNVYVCEGEVMSVQPLTMKQKYQALYVAMTRAKNNLVIFNQDF